MSSPRVALCAERVGLVRSLAGPGLTSVQAWTLGHIVRCPGCGVWVVVTDHMLEALLLGRAAVPVVCAHLVEAATA
ncbi:MAG: hypothetical protein ACRC35_00930 [Angustibacter sp.]